MEPCGQESCGEQWRAEDADAHSDCACEEGDFNCFDDGVNGRHIAEIFEMTLLVKRLLLLPSLMALLWRQRVAVDRLDLEPL